MELVKTLFAFNLSDDLDTSDLVTKAQAEKLFSFFKDCSLFRWSDSNNDCEDRANAISILLDEWKIKNAKGWVFSGYVLKKIGYLRNRWKYHVAALVPALDGDLIKHYIIDPATSDSLIEIETWAANITDNPHSFYLMKKGVYYIFNSRKIKKDNWYKRNKRNYNWTMQGLSGINGVSSVGKAHLAFNKKRVVQTALQFQKLKLSRPVL